MLAESCRTGKPNELSSPSGNVAIALDYAALKSIKQQGRAVRVADVIPEGHKRLGERGRHVALAALFRRGGSLVTVRTDRRGAIKIK
jgi:hypothetical protein